MKPEPIKKPGSLWEAMKKVTPAKAKKYCDDRWKKATVKEKDQDQDQKDFDEICRKYKEKP